MYYKTGAKAVAAIIIIVGKFTHFVEWYLKKSGVQAQFNANWPPYKSIAVRDLSFQMPPASRHTKYDA